MDIFRKASKSKKHLVKRNSLDFENYINGDLQISQGATSASFGDIRIIQSSPTPPQSPGSSMDLSMNTSVGDISIRSAPTPPHSTLTSAGTTPPSSTECSPEIRRKQWRHKILHLKDDIDKVCSKVKNAKSNIRDSVEAWKSKKASGRLDGGEEDREDAKKIRVEFIDKQSHGRHRALDKARRLYMAEAEEFDVPDHNISPSLVLTSLQNCMFTAQVCCRFESVYTFNSVACLLLHLAGLGLFTHLVYVCIVTAHVSCNFGLFVNLAHIYVPYRRYLM